MENINFITANITKLDKENTPSFHYGQTYSRTEAQVHGFDKGKGYETGNAGAQILVGTWLPI